MFRSFLHIIPAVMLVIALTLPASAEAGGKQHRNLRGRPVAQYMKAAGEHDHGAMSSTKSEAGLKTSKQHRNLRGRPVQHYR